MRRAEGCILRGLEGELRSSEVKRDLLSLGVGAGRNWWGVPCNTSAGLINVGGIRELSLSIRKAVSPKGKIK